MLRLFIIASITLWLMSLPSTTFAAGAVTSAKVTKVRVDDNGKVMVFFDKTISGTPPSCVHANYTKAYAFDSSTAAGKSVLSLVLMAKTTKDLIDAFGMGVCGVYGGSLVETWSYGQVK